MPLILWFLFGTGERRSAMLLRALLLLTLTTTGVLLEAAGVGTIPALVMLPSQPDDVMRVEWRLVEANEPGRREATRSPAA